MAAAAQPVPQGAPPPGPPSGAGPNPAAVVQLVKQLSTLSSMLGQVFPAASEEADGIQKLVQQVQSKVAQTSAPSQPQAPPI